MNLRDLQYLIAISDHQHFGKAAATCFVSQPALSIQIKKLEAFLGIKLIERSSKLVLMTETGLAITERARALLNNAQEIHEIAKQAADPYHGKLKLGIIPTLAPYLLPNLMPKLIKNFPKLKIHLAEEKTDFLIAKLREGKLDTLILALPIIDNDLVTTRLFEEEFLVALSKSHHLANRKVIKPDDLKNETLLLLEEGHCLRDQALALCSGVNIETQNFWTTSLETLRHMVTTNIGITLLPELACKPSNGIRYLPFKHNHKPFRSIGMVWRKSTAKEKLFSDIAGLIKGDPCKLSSYRK